MVKMELFLLDNKVSLQPTLEEATIMALGKSTVTKKLQLNLLNKVTRLFKCQLTVNQDNNGMLLDQRKGVMLN
jgi:hypothetical protein